MIKLTKSEYHKLQEISRVPYLLRASNITLLHELLNKEQSYTNAAKTKQIA